LSAFQNLLECSGRSGLTFAFSRANFEQRGRVRCVQQNKLSNEDIELFIPKLKYNSLECMCVLVTTKFSGKDTVTKIGMPKVPAGAPGLSGRFFA